MYKTLMDRLRLKLGIVAVESRVTTLEENPGGGGGGPGGPTWERYVINYTDMIPGEGDFTFRVMEPGEYVDAQCIRITEAFEGMDGNVNISITNGTSASGERVQSFSLHEPGGPNAVGTRILAVLSSAGEFVQFDDDRNMYTTLQWFGALGPDSLTAGQVEIWVRVNKLLDVTL